jgi:hypothetical protein
MPVNATTASPQEKLNYVESNLTAQRTLMEAISLLNARKGVATTAAEMEEIAVNIPRLQAKLLDLQADMTAFLAGTLMVNPPSAADVALIKTTTQSIYALTAASSTATAILQTATTVLTQIQNAKA